MLLLVLKRGMDAVMSSPASSKISAMTSYGALRPFKTLSERRRPILFGVLKVRYQPAMSSVPSASKSYGQPHLLLSAAIETN
jgi:hypothetical protein